MTDREKILAKIESLLNETNYEPFTDEVFGKIQSLKELKSYIDSLQEEPESIWHDAKEPPEMYRKYFARYSDGRINGLWERHDDGFIPWKDVVKEHNITYWCYVEDLLKL